MCNVKLDEWWRLHFFWIAVCAASLIAGFAAGWAWRDRPGALANVSILSALTALGTVGSVAVSLLISVVGYRRRVEREIDAAKGYARRVLETLRTAHLQLTTIRSPFGQTYEGNSHLSDNEAEILKGVLQMVLAVDTERLAVVSSTAGGDILHAITMLGHAVFLHSVHPDKHLKVTVDEVVEKAQKFIHKAQSECIKLDKNSMHT